MSVLPGRIEYVVNGGIAVDHAGADREHTFQLLDKKIIVLTLLIDGRVPGTVLFAQMLILEFVQKMSGTPLPV